MTLEDKLSKIRFVVDMEPHIRVNTAICANCSEKSCLYVCPIQNYILVGEKLIFNWQSCLECGACRLACSRGAIEWNYPRGGFGVSLRYG